jgi:predicted transcriptional regulator YheO
MNRKLKAYEPIVEAVVKLFFPYVEGAIHDLVTGKILVLKNNISKRKVGDPSPLHELKVPVDKFPDFFEPYYKDNWDGRKLKCTSITIRGEKNEPIGLICLNMDTTVFTLIGKQMENLLKVTTGALNPIEQFTSDWQTEVDNFIEKFVIEKNIGKNSFTREDKKRIVQQMYNRGLFNFKNAVSYIAKTLNISRATLYNYLNK